MCASDLLFALDDGQSFSHQFLVDPTEVGYFLLAFVMDVHATLCTEATVHHVITLKPLVTNNTVQQTSFITRCVFAGGKTYNTFYLQML